MNWRDGETNPKLLQHSDAFFQRSENRAQNVVKHRIRSICLYRHCNAIRSGNKQMVTIHGKNVKLKVQLNTPWNIMLGKDFK